MPGKPQALGEPGHNVWPQPPPRPGGEAQPCERQGDVDDKDEDGHGVGSGGVDDCDHDLWKVLHHDHGAFAWRRLLVGDDQGLGHHLSGKRRSDLSEKCP